MNTEAEAIAELASRAANTAAAPIELEPDRVYDFLNPITGDRRIIDTEDLAAMPRRPRGTVAVHDAASFLKAVETRLDEGVTVYADEENMALVAILNDDRTGVAGWRDHRVNLSLRRTDEWSHWLENGGLRPQEAFATAIEAGIAEIVDPPAATMLELAQSFQATVGVKFAQAGLLDSGARQFTFSEDVAARAGKGGTLEIPGEFKIGVKPFYGSAAYEVVARLRYRLREGELTIGYDLVKPKEVERAAFRGIVETVTAGIETAAPNAPVLNGVAPAPTVARN